MINGVSRVELKSRAKKFVKENYGAILLLTLIYVISGIANSAYSVSERKEAMDMAYYSSSSMAINWMVLVRSLATSLVLSVVQAPLLGGIINIIRGKNYKSAFDVLSRGGFWITTIITNLIAGIIIALGSVLLIVPGVIFALGLSQVVCLIYDLNNTPEVKEKYTEQGILAPIKYSWNLMKGHKVDYLVLNLSFILWSLLTAMTFGLAGFYVIPYIQTTQALWYNELLKENGIFIGDEIEAETETVEVTFEEE